MKRSPLIIGGVVLVALGLIGFAIPIFTTQQTKEVARIGDLKLQTTESTSYVVPPLLSGGVLVLGVILIGAGLYRKGYASSRSGVRGGAQTTVPNSLPMPAVSAIASAPQNVTRAVARQTLAPPARAPIAAQQRQEDERGGADRRRRARRRARPRP